MSEKASSKQLDVTFGCCSSELLVQDTMILIAEARRSQSIAEVSTHFSPRFSADAIYPACLWRDVSALKVKKLHLARFFSEMLEQACTRPLLSPW